ncbi:hypothetical protein J5N97_020760 [Dioscorea zingiberensis]|uniref:Glycoside hydrolase family 5 domain-containing protein n=1 Tax=Dioscorea zingiberensis TaxID=325984 RepID=A0A9D5CGE0_9LILI|nr:hypothetical protein J5N97_020760 [Dioscorea zingiberensis]
MEVMVAEGLSKQPLDYISNIIRTSGFNCVRLTWAIQMITNTTYSNITVRESFILNGLNDTAAALAFLNPGIIDLPLLQAFQAVIESLGRNGIMVVVDNHVSKPGWCCSNNDGNGFFGDLHFNPDEWLNALATMASQFRGMSNVVAMSLRNELRGHRQNTPDWYKYMQQGAEAVHKANPDLLVILSGLNFDTNLDFLKLKQVNLSFSGKLVFEFHWYTFSNRQGWKNGNLNDICSGSSDSVMKRAGFLLDDYPLFMSEFGINQDGKNIGDNHYIGCVLALAAEHDLDWALWSLPGSYYKRQGKRGVAETYAVVSYDWDTIRNPTFMQMLSSITLPFRGPGVDEVPEYKIVYHPMSGQCVLRNYSLNGVVELGPCSETEAWSFNENELGLINGTTSMSCMEGKGDGEEVKVGNICGGPNSKWDIVSPTNMQFSSQETKLCLDVSSDGKTLVTNPCLCLDGRPNCDPENQWFKLVAKTRKIFSNM